MQMIPNYSKLWNVTFIAFLIISVSACKKDSLPPKPAILNPDFKDIQLNHGFIGDGITINAKDWSVEYVKDAVSGAMLLDKAGKPMTLNAVGSVELQSGWLILEKKQGDDLLTVSLKENFRAEPRKFLIGILADGQRDELSFIQIRAESYEIVKKDIKEVPGSRKEYKTDEGLQPITLTNNTSSAKNMETSVIYKDVKYMSEFSSSDYGAFNWLSDEDQLIFMDEILRAGAIYWSDRVPYKTGQSFEPYIKPGDRAELLVPPNTSIKVRGEVLYLTRECLYTFTVKNRSSGNTFEISGTWKQLVPLSTSTHFYN